jgi:uncharacterized protein
MIGTKPRPEARTARPGRFTLVDGEGGAQYLYVPEMQKLFGVSTGLAELLQGGFDPASDQGQATARFISRLITDEPRPSLSERRSRLTGLRDVIVHPSQVCNLNCVYCYAVEFNKVNKLMSPETADSVVAHTMAMAPSGLSSVKFLGGEPTLAWPIVERMMAAYVAESARLGVSPPHFVMVTNGTKITPTLVESAARYGMHVLVSLDGPPAMHDKLRPTRSGSGSYLKASAGLAALRAGGVDVAVEGVYTRQHFLDGVVVQDMIDHFLALDVREFAIAPTVGIWHDADTVDQIEQVRGLFASAARASARSFRTERPYLLRGIQFVLDGYALRERRSHVCGAGRTFMAVNYDGEAFPCYLLESPATSYGVIGKSWDQARYEKVRHAFSVNGKAHHEVCGGCWANEICQSCLGTSWQISPEVTKPPAWFCGFQKAIIGAVLGEIASARESGDWPQFASNIESYMQPLLA